MQKRINKAMTPAFNMRQNVSNRHRKAETLDHLTVKS